MYVSSEVKLNSIDTLYRVYVTDVLRGMSSQFGGKVEHRFADLINTDKPIKQDDRSGDEIALDVINKLGLKVVNR